MPLSKNNWYSLSLWLHYWEVSWKRNSKNAPSNGTVISKCMVSQGECWDFERQREMPVEHTCFRLLQRTEGRRIQHTANRRVLDDSRLETPKKNMERWVSRPLRTGMLTWISEDVQKIQQNMRHQVPFISNRYIIGFAPTPSLDNITAKKLKEYAFFLFLFF